MKYSEKCPVVCKKAIAADIFDIRLYSPRIAAEAVCGQFVNVKAEGFFLRRPISLCGIDREKGELRLVFQVRGKGTEEISRLREGCLADIIGPLGKGFDLSDRNRKAVIIGGGIGVPPMVPIAEFYGRNATVITGFRSAGAVILQKDLEKTGAEVILCTDDGTAGMKGFVTNALEKCLEKEKPDIIYACGPMPMLRGIVKIADENGIRTQVSLEERMGCGVGGCLVCACRTVKDGREVYSHVCKDGPVFEAEEVLFS